MTAFRRRLLLPALVPLAAWCPSAQAESVVFETTFASDTMNVVPNVISPTAANWYVMSSKDARASDVNGFGGLTLLHTSSTAAVVEAAARLTPQAAAIGLPAVDDYIEASGVFYTDWILNMGFGFYNSGGVDPLVTAPNGTTLLENTGLVNTAGAVGGTLGWKGYRAQVANNSTTATISARQAQTGTPTYLAYDLVSVGTGGFNSPAAISVGTTVASPSAVTWTNGYSTAYRFIYRIKRSSATALQFTCTIKSEDGTTTLYSSSGTTTGATALPSEITSTFDSFAIGYRNATNAGAATVGSISVTQLKVIASNASIARITAQPANQSLVLGASGSLSVTGAGAGTLLYQWYKDGSPISGATSASYPIAAASAADIGSYTVKVSNAFGHEMSAAATVVVTSSTPPVFTLQPASQTVDAGSTLVLTASASGAPTPSYQWFRNGSPIDGAIFSSYVVENVTTAAAGSYYVVATNPQGSDTSNTITVSVTVAAPVITVEPAATTNVNVGDPISLSVTATGIPAPTYQWYFNSVLIPDATLSTYSIPSATVANQGTYTVVATNASGSDTSAPASVTVTVVPPALATQPSSTTVLHGESLSLVPAYSGSLPRTYQWYRNGSPIDGATGASYTLANVAVANAGTYHVVVTNGAGSATSDPAVVSVVFSQNTPVFSTDFTTSTFNNPATPLTPTSASWWVLASRVATNSTIGDDPATTEVVEARPLTLRFNTTTGSSIAEAATRFSSSPITLSSPGDFIRMTTTMKWKNFRILAFGLFNSGGSNPFPLIGNPAADILGSGTAANDQGTENWKGYRSSMQIATSSGDIGTRPAQTLSSTNRGNELIFPAGSTGTAFGEPAGVSIGSVPGVGATIAFTDDAFYTLVYTIRRSSTTQLTIGYRIFAGTSASGSPLYATEATTTDPAALPAQVTDGFDAVALGFRNLDNTSIPEFSLHALEIVHGTAAEGTLPNFVTSPASQSVAVGAGLTLNASASGFPAPTYQWFKDGAPIDGATGTSYTIASYSAGDAGSYQVVATNAVGSANSGTAVVTTASSATAYETWAAGWSLDPQSNGAPDANPSGDGVSNLLKFVLGGNPNSAGTTRLPTLSRPGADLVFSCDVENAALAEYTVSVETATSLTGTWTTAVHGVGGVVISNVALDGDTTRLTVTIPAAGNLFARLRVTEIP